MCTKSIKLHRSHVYQIHQTPPAAFVGFSTPQYSPVNRACSHVYQIHQTPPAAFVGFSTPHHIAQWIEHVAMCTKSIKLHRLLLLDSVLHNKWIEHVAMWKSIKLHRALNRACSHVYQIHQTPPAAFVGFSTPQYSPVNRACMSCVTNPSNSTGCFCWIQYSTV